MKITAQEEYGLRCLLQLARMPQDQVMRVSDIAEKEGLSNAYVEKLLRILGRAGLAHSTRGSRGGYTLNRPASQVTLGEVIRALGMLPTTEHICHEFTGLQKQCVHFDDCGIRSVWAGLSSYIQRYLDGATLADLLQSEYAVSEKMALRLSGFSKTERDTTETR